MEGREWAPAAVVGQYEVLHRADDRVQHGEWFRLVWIGKVPGATLRLENEETHITMRIAII